MSWLSKALHKTHLNKVLDPLHLSEPISKFSKATGLTQLGNNLAHLDEKVYGNAFGLTPEGHRNWINAAKVFGVIAPAGAITNVLQSGVSLIDAPGHPDPDGHSSFGTGPYDAEPQPIEGTTSNTDAAVLVLLAVGAVVVYLSARR